MATAREIITFRDPVAPEGASAWVDGRGPATDPRVVEADPAWPATYARLAALIGEALGDAALTVTHVGSTAVPGLAAKPVIDIDLVVADPADEAIYLPALERRGFVLTIREPWWHGHRCLRLAEPACNLHVFGPGEAETERHLIFRDWLRAHPEDRVRYAAAKRAAAERTREAGGHVMDYNARKQTVVREIYARAFRGLGLSA